MFDGLKLIIFGCFAIVLVLFNLLLYRFDNKQELSFKVCGILIGIELFALLLAYLITS